jgi:hypothetical protein
MSKKSKRKPLLKTACLTLLLIFCLTLGLTAQDIEWKRQPAAVPELALFHSTQVLDLPTAETLQKGDFQFEILHRFNLPVSTGYGQFYGLDGTVTMRIGLGYALTDHMLATLARSNREGNIELQYKYMAFEIPGDLFPVMISAQAGIAYNGKPVQEITDPSRKFQYFGQIIANTMIEKKFGIGLVPSYLYNAHIYCKDIQHSFTLGGYLQHYIWTRCSLILEYNATISGWRDQYDSIALGIEIETGGHFFKFSFGNSTALNMSQYLQGAPDKIDSNDWHLGFNITRLF